MKLFGFNISRETSSNSGPTTMGSMAFSTPFMKIGKGNLSSPYVNRFYTQTGGFVRFGEDNLYPQLLNQLYFQSAIHGAIIDFITNTVAGGGYVWKDEKVSAQQAVEQLAFDRKHKFSKFIFTVSRDYIIHKRICILIRQNEQGQVIKMRRLDPSTIRNTVAFDKYGYSPDWSRGYYEFKEFPPYYKGCKHLESLFVYQDETPGQDVYPIPTYNSILNWAYLDSEQSYFHKSNIQNSVFPSAVIRRPKEFGSIDEINKFKQEIHTKTGAGNGGRVLVLTGNGFDDTPEFQQVSPNGNDALFTATAKELKDQICFAHSINPSIVGIKVAGSLGNSEELRMSYAIFQKNVVMPLRKTLTDVFNELVDICGVKNTIVLNEYQIIEDQIVETTDTTKTEIK